MASFLVFSNLTKNFLKLLLFYAIYVHLGAVLFIHVEEDDQCLNEKDKQPYEDVERSNSTCIQSALCQDLKVLLSKKDYDFDYLDFYCVYRKHCLKLQPSIHVKPVDSYSSNCSENEAKVTSKESDCSKWTLRNQVKWASFTSATVFTIGYGDPVPQTTLGRILMIIYALIGMPFALAMLVVGGQLVIHKLTILVDWIERMLGVSNQNEHRTLKLLIATFSFFILTLIGGVIISVTGHLKHSHWTVSLYFWFQTITTIGYGDITMDRDYLLGWRFLLIIPYILFLIFGLALMSALLNLLSTLLVSGEWKNYSCRSNKGAK